MTELTDYLTDRYQVLDTFSENERARVEPVSYTHLDVYKRQPKRDILFGGAP